MTDNEGFLYGGGLSIHDTTVRMRNSIVDGNFDKSSGEPSDCYAPPEYELVSGGYNLIGSTTGLPITWKPKRKLRLAYDVLFECANDPAAGTSDYEVSARVHHVALGSADAHPQDDFCPRTVSPPGEVDAFPDGKIRDRGCGAKLPDRTRGGALAVDVTGP